MVGSANADTLVSLAALPAPGETVLGTSLGRNPGGKGLNQAVAAARMGVRVVMCGAVGDDADGRTLRSVMADEDVDDSAVVTSTGTPTGSAHVYALPGAENSIVVAPGANLTITPSHAAASVARAGVVLVQCEVPVEAVEAALRAGRSRGAVTILNAAPVTDRVAALLPHADVVIVNESEAAALGGAAKIASAGPSTVVVTRGGAGTELHRGGDVVAVPAVRVDPVDTTGAGDAFCGAYAAARAAGLDDVAAVRRGNAAGALATTAWGAQGAQLSVGAVDKVMGQGFVAGS
ncbi:ribokinase [Demequina sp. SO4-18]|uniref:ribokinase n=1 Tax=Demequina sp. SO4-18 TaxID=3401026 RepID=UPI003B59EF82